MRSQFRFCSLWLFIKIWYINAFDASSCHRFAALAQDSLLAGPWMCREAWTSGDSGSCFQTMARWFDCMRNVHDAYWSYWRIGFWSLCPIPGSSQSVGLLCWGAGVGARLIKATASSTLISVMAVGFRRHCDKWQTNNTFVMNVLFS